MQLSATWLRVASYKTVASERNLLPHLVLYREQETDRMVLCREPVAGGPSDRQCLGAGRKAKWYDRDDSPIGSLFVPRFFPLTILSGAPCFTSAALNLVSSREVIDEKIETFKIK